MRKLYALILLALAGTGSAFAQWNTNATPKLIFGLNYTDPLTGEAKTGGDYYACSPKVARTADKKTWISWKTARSFELNGIVHSGECTYLQLLDINGVPQFEEPILVNDHATPSWWSQYALRVAADGSAIVTVADSRAEEADLTERNGQAFTPAIYKIDQEGNFLWGLDGIEYRNVPDGPYTNAFVAGDDTYFVYARTDGDEAGTFIQRISADGVELWDEPMRWPGDLTLQLQIWPTTNNEVLVFDGCPDGARVHRMDKDLKEEVWGDAVIYDDYKYEGYEMNHYRIVSDGNGGACVAFLRNMGNFSHNIRVQHINEDGSLGFGLTGLDAYNADAYDHNYPSIAANPETQEILVQFASDQGDGKVVHQKFSYDGDYLYDELGLAIASKRAETSGSYFYSLVGVGSLSGGDWICCYRDLAGYNSSSFVIRRYDKDGNCVWTKTIGRELGPSDVQLVVEEEAAYLFYRETKSGKEPGIKIFRIGADGTYNVTYEDLPTGIKTVDNAINTAKQYYSLDGKQLTQPQHGLNIVRQGDGTVRKLLR
ncbi:MAG: hypothetical protein IJ200_07335 [Prevotella sp.]|nr:hypothetical protein [Prevotella sp.]